MPALLSFALSPLGKLLMAGLAGATLLTGVYAYAHKAGRVAERQAILERSVDLLRKRNRTDDQIHRMDDAGLCAALGGRVSDDGRCQ